MVWGRKIVLLALTGALLVAVGCKKKKPPVPQPQSQAPTITTPEPSRPTQPETQPQAQPQPQPQPEVTPPQPAPTPPPKPKKHIAKKKPVTPPPATASKPKVVPEGGTENPSTQLSAGIPHDEAQHQQQTTAQLLATTDANLKSITRSLSSDEQAMVQQIRNYMDQSRLATKEGDLERAHNLALKAHLLSDELVKR